MTMNRKEIAAARAVGWIVLALVSIVFGADQSSDRAADRPDVENVASVMEDAESAGDWCWTGGSDVEPDYVIFSRGGKVQISHRRVHIDNAIEQGVFGVDHGIDPGFAFCADDAR